MPSEAINILTNLDTLGVSLVKRGANRRRFAVTKSEDGTMDEKFVAMMSAIVKEAGYEGEEKLADLIQKQELGEKEQNAIKAALRILNAFRDNEQVSGLADALAQAVGYPKPKPADEAGYPEPMAAAKATPEQCTTKEDKQMADEATNAGYPAPMMKALEGMPQEQRDAMAPVLKAMWSAVAKDSAEKIEKAEARAAKTEAILKAERDERQKKEYIAKAERELANLPGKPEEVGLVLKSLHDLNPEIERKVEEVLKSAQAALESFGAFGERGRSGEGTAMESDAWAAIEKSAEASK